MDLQPLIDLKDRYKDGLAGRVLAELSWALQLCEADGLDPAAARAAMTRLHGLMKTSAPGAADFVAVEESLKDAYGAASKAYTVVCAGHAHIDMNWMWGYDETVAVALDTVETVLRLMEEFPGFYFSQSQASVYEILAEHGPDLLDAVRRRIAQGRWEVTAATWVEADRNMGTGESIARHLLYTKEYLSKLLDIDAAALKLDFEPDTFGHGAFTPEALSQAGVRWYYHCRGDDGAPLYRWQAPSGKEVLCYREPEWYLGPITADLAGHALHFCKQTGMKTALWVYGVGDHGGGPTRRDLMRIVEYGGWPVFPKVEFGPMARFYEQAEKVRGSLPVVREELNFVFPGCYTTQSRIKTGNFDCQRLLTEAETLSCQAEMAGVGQAADLAAAWKPVLFNQFHDIVTGSGVMETRERALGQYQGVRAQVNTLRTRTLRAVAAQVDTSPWAEQADDSAATSEGAGVGYGAGRNLVSQTGRHGGRRRLFHIFNPTAQDRDEVAELTLWDYDLPIDRITVSGADGKPLPFQALEQGYNSYWGHHYATILVRVAVPALGRTLAVVDQAPVASLDPGPRSDPRTEPVDEWVLENEALRAVLDNRGALVSLFDKAAGRETLAAPAGFGYAVEDAGRGMTAWIVGRFMQERCVHAGPVKLISRVRGPLRQAVTYEVPFGDHSRMTVTARLDAGSSLVRFDADVHFLDWGGKDKGVPQLFFAAPPAKAGGPCRCDVPLGWVERPALPHDVPALSHAAAGGLVLSSPGRYGYRWQDGRLAVDLLRAAFDPDPYPELGQRAFTVGLGVDGGAFACFTAAETLCAPLAAVSDDAHGGSRPAHARGLAVPAPARLQCLKPAQDGNGYILRLTNLSENDATVTIPFPRPLRAARPVNFLEQAVADADPVVAAATMTVTLAGRSTAGWRIEL